jgi:hypothetical protein
MTSAFKSHMISITVVTPISKLKSLRTQAPHCRKPGTVCGYHVIDPFDSTRIGSELITDSNRRFQFVDELDSTTQICAVGEGNRSQHFAQNSPRFEANAFLLVVDEVIVGVPILGHQRMPENAAVAKVVHNAQSHIAATRVTQNTRKRGART